MVFSCSYVNLSPTKESHNRLLSEWVDKMTLVRDSFWRILLCSTIKMFSTISKSFSISSKTTAEDQFWSCLSNKSKVNTKKCCGSLCSQEIKALKHSLEFNFPKRDCWICLAEILQRVIKDKKSTSDTSTDKVNDKTIKNEKMIEIFVLNLKSIWLFGRLIY